MHAAVSSAHASTLLRLPLVARDQPVTLLREISTRKYNDVPVFVIKSSTYGFFLVFQIIIFLHIDLFVLQEVDL